MCYATNRGRVTGRAFDDNNEAVKWFHKAAKNGDVMAQYTLGRFYEYGGIKNMTNIHENHIEAVNWYRKAAERGSSRAQRNLGRCYLEGKGIAQNKTEAINWYRKAAIRGDSYSKKILNDLGEVW